MCLGRNTCGNRLFPYEKYSTCKLVIKMEFPKNYTKERQNLQDSCKVSTIPK